jgi:predicted GNAT superfamily acetyltransferase
MLCVIRHIGGYVSGAYDAGELVGVCAAFPTAGGGLHSHITGVTVPGRGTGLAIKLHQREWARGRGMNAITWTFDPLVRRNAYFNLVKLAARAEEYVEDFYGEMPDELNAGDPSDRLIMVWDVDARTPPTVAAHGAETATALTDDPSGRPVECDVGRAKRLAVGTPADIAALRAGHPPLAREWRRAQRAALGGSLAAGYEVIGFTRSGHYLLEVVR